MPSETFTTFYSSDRTTVIMLDHDHRYLTASDRPNTANIGHVIIADSRRRPLSRLAFNCSTCSLATNARHANADVADLGPPNPNDEDENDSNMEDMEEPGQDPMLLDSTDNTTPVRDRSKHSYQEEDIGMDHLSGEFDSIYQILNEAILYRPKRTASSRIPTQPHRQRQTAPSPNTNSTATRNTTYASDFH